MQLQLTICDGRAYPVGGCCAICAIRHFPQDKYYAFTEKEVKDWEEEITAFEQEIASKGKSIAFASVNMTQKKAGEMLERLGYVCPFDGWAIRDPEIEPKGGGVRVYVKPVFKTIDK